MIHLKKITINRLKPISNQLIWAYRRVTWRSRRLPDFIIIGAQKSGTSSLYAYLSQHPQIVPSFLKEVHFFDGVKYPAVDMSVRSQAWYRAHFPVDKKINDHCKTFEASPLYIFHPLAPKRIHDLLPEVKMIAILRNPTERTVSHYLHSKRFGYESLPFEKALQAEKNRLESAMSKNNFTDKHFIHHSYKKRGLYKQQLERYFEYFRRDQLFVISSEELFFEPQNALQQVFNFLEIDNDFKVKDLKPRNVTNIKTRIAPSVYQDLNEYFLPHNTALFNLIGRRFAW